MEIKKMEKRSFKKDLDALEKYVVLKHSSVANKFSVTAKKLTESCWYTHPDAQDGLFERLEECLKSLSLMDDPRICDFLSGNVNALTTNSIGVSNVFIPDDHQPTMVVLYQVSEHIARVYFTKNSRQMPVPPNTVLYCITDNSECAVIGGEEFLVRFDSSYVLRRNGCDIVRFPGVMVTVS